MDAVEAPSNQSLEIEITETKKLSLPSTVLSLSIGWEGSLLCACMDGGIYRIDIESGEREELFRHDSFASSVHWLPERRLVLSAGYDGRIQWFDVDRGLVVRYIDAHDFLELAERRFPDRRLIASVTASTSPEATSTSQLRSANLP